MDTTVAAERTVSMGSHEVFALFGRSSSAGWLFGARCEAVRPGAMVSMRLPADHAGPFDDLCVLGRLSHVVPGRRIDIEHTQPWRGRVSVRLSPATGGGTRIRVRASVPPQGVDWLLHRAGLPLPAPPDDAAIRVGAVTTSSGSGAVYSMSSTLLAELAVEEINLDGGAAGRDLRLVAADDGTDPDQAVLEAERMIRLGCRVVFVNSTSACFEAVRTALDGRGVLLVHTVMNEGGNASPTAVRLGERPRAQTEALVGPMMRTLGARSWFLVGQSYVWSWGAHAMARRVVDGAGGRVVDERLRPLGTTDFSTVVDDIRRSGAELVLSSLVGADEVAFERQVAAAGLRESTRTLSLALEESTLALIGPEASEGIHTALSYLQDSPVAGNADLLRRYRSRYGEWAPPITTFSETVYEAIHQYARVLHADPDGSPAAHGLALRQARRGAGDSVGSRNLVHPQLYIAQAGSGGLHIRDAR